MPVSVTAFDEAMQMKGDVFSGFPLFPNAWRVVKVAGRVAEGEGCKRAGLINGLTALSVGDVLGNLFCLRSLLRPGS